MKISHYSVCPISSQYLTVLLKPLFWLFFFQAPRAKDKDWECDILNPVALMFNEKEGKLYIGENGRITVKQGIYNAQQKIVILYLCHCHICACVPGPDIRAGRSK